MSNPDYSGSYIITLRDFVPNAKGKYLMCNYEVCAYEITKPSQRLTAPADCYGGILAYIDDWRNHQEDYFGHIGFASLSIHIRNKQLRDVIKMYTRMPGFAGLSLNQYVDHMLGKDFRKKFKMSILSTSLVNGKSKYIKT